MKKRRSSHGLQMFSFLDAMVCTVGALLVLLHAFARHGADEAARKADVLSSTARSQQAAQHQEFEARLAQLKQLKASLQAELDDEHTALSHVEDHQRRLMERLRELQIAAAELDRNTQGTAQERQALLDQLAAIRAQVASARKAKDLAKSQVQERAATYSVVPYEGPNSTRRRPIYIECRESSIILQPEGIELGPGDFAGMNGPGNPLAAALRGMREYWMRQSPGKPPEEPYPLLLVRPEGIGSYYWARAALDSWGADFGYELVGADWTLKFPDADPQLRDLTKKIVADSRGRMQELAVASRQLAKERQRGGYYASARGGLVPDRTPRNGGAGGGFMGNGAGGWDSLGSDWAKGGTSPRGSSAGGSFGGGNSRADDGTSGEEIGRYGQRYGEGGTGTGRYGSEQGTGSKQARGAAGREGNANGSDSASGDQGGDEPFNYSDPTAKGGNSTARSGSSSTGSGSGSPAGGSATTGSKDANGGPGGASSVSMGSPNQHGSAPGGSKTQSMAKSRGSNWGLPESSVGAAGVTRPIRVNLYNDRLVIMPEDNRTQPKQVALSPQARENMDEFVNGVWQHMKGWGIAGKGFYWKPTLVMEIAPGAADRYAEVKSLLADSGLDVRERTQPQNLAQPPRMNPSR